MNIPRVTVTRVSQVEPGAVYLVTGTGPNMTHNIPPQLFRVTSKVRRSGALGRPCVSGDVYVNLGELGRRCFPSTLYLDSVGIYEGYSKVADMAKDPVTAPIIDNDVHLERLPDTYAAELGKIAQDQAWNDFVRKRNGAALRPAPPRRP